MKKITLKKMHLTNFKGIRSKRIEFGEGWTKISGKNGAGKTTIFDAFVWALFGKNSEDAKQFNIKTLDENGEAIPRLPHEVTAVLDVDGAEVRLCRRYSEKWVKPKGGLAEEFKGHEEERIYNDVPYSVREWQGKIDAICTEQVFKMITNPFYFTSQKPDMQRQMLFRMAGDVSDADIAKENEEFGALLERMSGKSIAEYKREISAKKKRIKAEAETIPARIDELKRIEGGNRDRKKVEAEIKDGEKALAEIDGVLQSAFEAEKARVAELNKEMEAIATMKQNLIAKRNEVKNNALSEYYKREEDRFKSEMQRENAQNEIESLNISIAKNEKELEGMDAQLKQWRDDFRKRDAEEIEFNEADFVCPTCKRPFDENSIEETKAKLMENFNLLKAQDTATIQMKGKALGKEYEKLTQITCELKTRVTYLQEYIETHPVPSQIEKPNGDFIADADFDVIAMKKEIESMEKEYEAKAKGKKIDNSEMQERKKEAAKMLDGLKSELAKIEEEEKRGERIKELEREYGEMQGELARLEGEEWTMAEFSRKKASAIEERVNGMFERVKFRLFERQVNGEEVETCEATVGGVPFSDLNNAGRILAGLDIINAVCRSEGVCAPIFIDNAESVNSLPGTEGQLVGLYVTEDEELRVAI